MGYELSIFRDYKSEPITEIEWNDLFTINNEFQMLNTISGIYKSQNAIFSFSRIRGVISVINPNKLVVNKMIEIAAELNAYVIGENGEYYNSLTNNENYLEYEFIKVEKKKEWFEFWK